MDIIEQTFIDHIMYLIDDNKLAGITGTLLHDVPKPFWTVPASSSGKHHPEYASGEHGLVKHTLMVVHIARDLAQAYGLTSPEDLDIVTIAAAVHDTYKGGLSDDWSQGTQPDHAIIAMYAMPGIMPSQVKDAIGNHMSMWNPPGSSRPISSLKPHSQVVAAADYIASRKYLEPSSEMMDFIDRVTKGGPI